MSTEIVELTAAEIAERSQTLAQKIAEHDQIESEKKESNSNFSKLLKTINVEIRELSNVVRSGKEYKQSKGLFEIETDESSAM